MKKATRKSFGEALATLGKKYPQVVCLDADLSKSTMSMMFAKEFPNRFYEMGIQEANMIGVASGMSFAGKVPFICSFAAFLTGRFDQIRMSIGYSDANVKLIGTHCGVGIGEDGHSQMGLEDIALMRSIPNMTVLQPASDSETFQMVEWAINHKGPVYIRLTRQGLEQLSPAPFQLGVYPQIHEGRSTAFFATGGTLEMATIAARELVSCGHHPSVYNAHTVRPLNDKFLKSLEEKYSQWVVLEDHSVMGGTGSALAEWVGENSTRHVKVYRYGVQDVFGESGTPYDLYQKHGFNTQAIKDWAIETLSLSN